jgi:NAD(P)-dependent dehydrogenase (short-subunit alcohol dehydrogenase family)
MTLPLAIVAGVGPGMGLALARRYIRDGHRVAMIARRAESLDAFAAELGEGATGHPADLADLADIARVMDEIRAAHGPADRLHYNPSIWNEQPAMAFPPDEFQRDMALCVTGGLVAAQAVLPDMKAAGRGTMLFTGGGLALTPQHGTPVPSLAAGKAALRALVLAMAGELRPHGIRVGTVTVAGAIARGSRFDPDRISAEFAALAALPPEDETVEVIFRGADPA